MKYDPAIHNRRSIRLKGYSYSLPGAYFMTIVTQGREMRLGEILEGEMVLSQFGCIVLNAWQELPRHYPNVELGDFVVMPNHVHGIVVLVDDSLCSSRGGSQTRPYDARPYEYHGLPEIVRAFKSFSARRINAIRGTTGQPVWQRNYYEHIVRDQVEWERIIAYIQANPKNWQCDDEYFA